jgi:hypothetical protein
MCSYTSGRRQQLVCVARHTGRGRLPASVCRQQTDAANAALRMLLTMCGLRRCNTSDAHIVAGALQELPTRHKQASKHAQQAKFNAS